MAEDYTKTRSSRNPSMSSYGGKPKRSSKMGYNNYSDYGKKSDRYAGMPKGEMKELKDGTHSPYLYAITTETQKDDLGRMRYDSVGMKGYARQAFAYDY